MVTFALFLGPVHATSYALPSETSAISSRLQSYNHTTKAIETINLSKSANITVAAYNPNSSSQNTRQFFNFSNSSSQSFKSSLTDNHLFVFALSFAPLLFLFLSIYQGLKRADERLTNK
jgi:hypothetical protein